MRLLAALGTLAELVLLWASFELHNVQEHNKELLQYKGVLEEALLSANVERDTCRRNFAQYLIEHDRGLKGLP